MKACPKCGTEYSDAITLCPADGSALEKTDDSLLGQVLADKYRIDERLSAGGMGTVYRGTHVLMDKTVAIKVLLPSFAADEKIVARFSREARAASKISHPHALSVTDFGEAENGVVFLVMEYLDGKTLKEIIRENGPMQLPRAVEILRQVGGALDAAHSEGVVHRDLKSDNIMLLSSSGTDYAKVLDFGIAKIKEPEGAYDPCLTAPDLVIGTPQYMSPEQCSQSPDIDARSDIYSLGVILYEMLVGHVLLTGVHRRRSCSDICRSRLLWCWLRERFAGGRRSCSASAGETARRSLRHRHRVNRGLYYRSWNGAGRLLAVGKLQQDRHSLAGKFG